MVEFCTFGNPSKSYFCYCSELLSKQRERPLKQPTKKSRITLIDKIKDEEEEEEKQKEENNNKNASSLIPSCALIFLGAIEDDDEESLRTAITSNETECVSVYIPTSVRD